MDTVYCEYTWRCKHQTHSCINTHNTFTYTYTNSKTLSITHTCIYAHTHALRRHMAQNVAGYETLCYVKLGTKKKRRM